MKQSVKVLMDLFLAALRPFNDTEVTKVPVTREDLVEEPEVITNGTEETSVSETFSQFLSSKMIELQLWMITVKSPRMETMSLERKTKGTKEHSKPAENTHI